MKKVLTSIAVLSTIGVAGWDRVEIKNGTDPAKTVKSVKDSASKFKGKSVGVASELKNKVFPKHKADTLTLITNYNSVTPAEIITRAHKAAGGLTWARPLSLTQEGYAVYYQGG